MVNTVRTFSSAQRRGHKPSRASFIFFLLIAGLFYLVAAANTASAATYYVDADNGDDSNPGTSDAPWRTIAKAESSAVNGSTVYLRSGNYGEVYINSSGLNRASWDDGISYEAEAGAAPVFSWTDITGSEDRYLTFKNIDFIVSDNSRNAVIFIIDSSHIRIIDSNITRPWPPTLSAQKGIWIDGKNNGVYDIVIDGCNIEGGYHGILTLHDIRDGIVIRNNHIHLTASSFITLQSSDNNGEIIVENNHMHDRRKAIDSHGSGLAVRVNRLTVRGNIIHDYGGSGGINFYDDKYRDTPDDGYEDMLIENNLVYDAQGVTNSRFSMLKSNITIRNNTLIGWRSSEDATGVYKYHAAIFKPRGAGGVTNLNVYNNVFVGYVSFSGELGSFNENNNIFYAVLDGTTWLTTPRGNNSIIVYNVDDDYFEGSGKFFVGGDAFDQYSYTHPGYIDTYNVGASHKQNLNDAYQLASGSDAIGFADPACAPAADLLGNPRDAAPDAGCYEYQPINPDTTAPSIPQNLTAQAVSESQIDLSWHASSDPESGISYYKIYRADSQIDTSVSTSYSNIRLDGGTTYSYEVSAVNGQGLESGQSNTAQATTFMDTTPPSIVSVSVSQMTVAIVFSESLEAASAENTSNYDITSGISVIAASLAGDLITVTLTTSSHTEGSYTLTVEAVRDIAGNPIVVPVSEDYEYTSGLVGYWKFDEATGSTAFDSSGSGHHGTLINEPTWTSGKLGGALSFNGTYNYVEIGAQDIASPWTVSLWVEREDSLNSNAALLDSSNYSLKLEQYPNTNKVGLTAYGVADYTFDYEAPIAAWIHLVFVGTSTETRLYVNGTLTDTISGSISCPMGQISSVFRAVKGIVDEVRVYNRSLTAGEVLELYNSAPPALFNIQATNISSSGATITWNTDENSTSQVEYGLDTSYGSITDLDTTLVTSHSVLLTGLASETLYHYRVRSKDSSGNESISQDNTFTPSGSSTYSITASAGAGGQISPSSTTQVSSGGSQTYTITANAEYYISDVVVDGSSVGAVGGYTFTNVTANHTIAATFAINTYTITASASSGGTISPNGTTQVNSGGAQTYTITPNAGYHIADVAVDGSSVGTVSSYSFTNVTANRTIVATFAINTYTIIASASNGGQLSPSGTTVVNWGDTQIYTITPNAGYHITDVFVDGSSVSAVTSYSFTNVTANHTIAATFAIDELDVTAPTVSNLSPQADMVQVPLNSLIILHITDAGEGVDANLVTIEVNNNIVYTDNTAHYNSQYGDCYRTGTKADYTFIYQSNEMFDYDQAVTVTVNAADLASPSNAIIPEHSYSFSTEVHSFGENMKVDSGLDSLGKGRPVTVQDSNGNIWVAWDAGTTGSRDIYISELAAGVENFGSGVQLTDNAADQCNPAIALGSDDTLYVVWQDNRRGNWDIYISTSVDGINWSAETRVTDSNDNQVNPAIVIDGQNYAHVVWQDDQGGNQDIYVATSSDGFVTKTISQITSNSSDQIDPAIAADSDNTIYLVWTDTRNGSYDIYGAASNDGPWTNVAVVSKAGSQSSPAIATEAAGSILHLLWIDDTPGDDDIFYAKTTGGLPPSPLSGSSIIDDSSGADQLEPVIAVTGTGNNLGVFACWQDERWLSSSSMDTDLFFAEISSSYGTNVFVGDDGTNANQRGPAIGIDGYGYPYLVWIDDRSCSGDNYYYAGSIFVESIPLISQDVPISSGAIVGTNPANITGLDDVSVIVPAGAYFCDIRITISRIENPLDYATDCLAAYDFGPSGIKFSQPVTIAIPYRPLVSNSTASVHWYDSLTGLLSQKGVTDIQDIVISPTLHVMSFKTTHFTAFYLLFGDILPDDDDPAATVTGSGGGGCSISATGEGNIVGFLMPYVGLAVVMVMLRLRDTRNRKARNITNGKC